MLSPLQMCYDSFTLSFDGYDECNSDRRLSHTCYIISVTTYFDWKEAVNNMLRGRGRTKKAIFSHYLGDVRRRRYPQAYTNVHPF